MDTFKRLQKDGWETHTISLQLYPPIPDMYNFYHAIEIETLLSLVQFKI